MLPFGKYEERTFHNLTFDQGSLDYEATFAHMNGISNHYDFENCTFINCSFNAVDFALYFKVKNFITFIGCSFNNCWFSSVEEYDNNVSLSLEMCDFNDTSVVAAAFKQILISGCNFTDSFVNDLTAESRAIIEGCQISNSIFSNIYIGGYGFEFNANYIIESLLNYFKVEAGKFSSSANVFQDSTIRVKELPDSDSYNSNSFIACHILDEKPRY